VAALLAEVEELKARRQSRGCAYVTVDKGEDRTAEIDSLVARGYFVVVSIITDPPPRIMEAHETLPPDVRLVVDQDKARSRKNAVEVRRTRPLGERPSPIEYPEQGY
jgi:hypothetical protein